MHAILPGQRNGERNDVVRFENVGVRYGSGPEILRDISFELEGGSFHFLTGPSGAGKTSLLKLMYLAQRPTRGLVRLFGRDVTVLKRPELPPLRRRIGVVFRCLGTAGARRAFEPLMAALHATQITTVRHKCVRVELVSGRAIRAGDNHALGH